MFLFYIRFSGFKHSNSGSTNLPSFLIRASSKYISPPPYSGVCILTISQWILDLFPLSLSSRLSPGVKWKLPFIFSSNSVSPIGFSIYGFNPITNSPIYLAPSSVSNISFNSFSLFVIAFTIFPFSTFFKYYFLFCNLSKKSIKLLTFLFFLSIIIIEDERPQ